MNRDELIDICERAIVSVADWSNRDTPAAHLNIGICWALLKAGCTYEVRRQGKFIDCYGDDTTIWLDITYPNFDDFEGGWQDITTHSKTFYLPTLSRLKESNGDWY
jgi:hypothetical protein